MKKFLILALLAVLTAPAFAQTTFACEEECVPADEATEETLPEDICPVVQTGMVPLNPLVMRNARLRSAINDLEAVGGVYQEGWNRFDVMKAIFEIEQAAKGNR